MKKLRYLIPALFAFAFVAIMLVSCGKYNFYNDWTSKGANIDKDNCFEVIELDDAKKKIDSKETFVLMIGASDAANAETQANTITSIYNTTEYLNFKNKIYFLDGNDYIKSIDSRREVNEKVGTNDFSKVSSDVIIVLYSKGEIKYDSSKKAKDDDKLSNMSSLITYICTDFDFEA